MNVGKTLTTQQGQLWLRVAEMPIVVKIAEKVKAAGAKGHYWSECFR